MTKFSFLSALFMCLAILLVSCNDDISIPDQFVVYRNSFEAQKDTAGWKNRENLKIIKEGAPGYGGTYSLFVRSKVASQPATSFDFKTEKVNDKLKFIISGKMQDTLEKAFVKFEPAKGESGDSLTIEIKGSGWKDYKTQKIFLVPSSRKFRFSVYTSAKANAGVQLDKFAILRVK